MNWFKEISAPITATVTTLRDRHLLPQKCNGIHLYSMMAILNTVKMAFPTELKKDSADTEQLMSRMFYLLPVLISCNDWCDFGSKLKGENPLLTMARDNVRIYLQNSLGNIAKAHNGDRRFLNIIQGFIKDSFVMSRLSTTIPSAQHREFLELDSMIFIVASLGATVPSVLEGVAFDPTTEAGNFPDMAQKYSCLYRDSRIRGLHATEMVLKVDDDTRVPEFDTSMNNPSFFGADANLRELKQRYLDIARESHLPLALISPAYMFTYLPDLIRIAKDLTRTKQFGSLKSEEAIKYALDGRITMRTAFQYSESLVKLLQAE